MCTPTFSAANEPQAQSLRATIRSGTTKQRTVMCARTILRTADGSPHAAIADEIGLSVPTVRPWRRRFKEQGLADLADAPQGGRPRTSGRETLDEMLAETVKTADETLAKADRKAQADSGARP